MDSGPINRDRPNYDFRCPACEQTLKEYIARHGLVHACDGGCGGVWLDSQVLDYFRSPSEPMGESLLEIRRNPAAHVDPGRRRICPKCRFYSMEKYNFSPDTKVVLDACNRCGGIWLDGGDLDSIREIARRKADQTTFIERRPTVDPEWDEHHPRPKPVYEVSTREELHKILYCDPVKREGVWDSLKNFLDV